MSITLDGLVLPSDLWWEDETEWTPVAQDDDKYSVTGAMLVDTSVKQAGRPITLAGAEDTSWIARSTVLALMALAAVPGKEMTLVIDTRSFQVIFSHADGVPLEAVPVYKKSPPADADYYWFTVRLKAI